MKHLLIGSICVLFLLIACKSNTSRKETNTKFKTNKQIPNSYLTIKGDFDGDGIQEELKEIYINELTQKEINKHSEYGSIKEYDSVVSTVGAKKAVCYLVSSNKNISKLDVEDGKRSYQLFGLAFLKNEGDINFDGKDELSLVVDYADWSSINVCEVFTYTNNKWISILSIDIHESSLFDTTDFNGFITKNADSTITYEHYDPTFENDTVMFPKKTIRLKPIK